MKNMDSALVLAEAELEGIEQFNAEINENTDVEKLLGIENNDSGETKVVKMTDKELRDALTYKTYKILQDYTDEYSISYEYVSDGKYEDLVKHYVGLVVNTEEYLKLEPAGNLGVMVQGTINKTTVYIDIDNSDPGKVRVSTYLDLSTKK